MATKSVNPKVVAGSLAALPAAPFAQWIIDQTSLPENLKTFAVGLVAAAIVFGAAWLKSEFPAIATYFDKPEQTEPVVPSGSQIAAAAADPVDFFDEDVETVDAEAVPSEK